ncbi:hypothetical protein KMI_11g16930 [Encephalitozoon hellem]|nr:hypothetical protein KMI_11g16930 [Encephalitozoon hellem]
MKNNGSGKDDDDFWKILSESDSEYESGIGLLFKPKKEEGCLKPEIEDEAQKADDSIGSKKEDVLEEDCEDIICEKVNDLQESSKKKENSEDIEDTQACGDESLIKSLEEEPEDGKNDYEAENTCEESLRLKSETNTNSGVLSEPEPRVSSVDEMDFLWDDDDEEFIVGEVSSMSIEKKSPNNEDTPKSADDSLEHISCAVEELDTKDKEVQEDKIDPKESDPEDQAIESLVKLPNPRMDPMKPKPLARFVSGGLLTVFMSSQRRFNMQGEATQNYINISQWHRLDYALPDIKPSNFITGSKNSGDDRYRHVYDLVRLEKPSIDSISSIVSDSRPVYCSRDINRLIRAESMNRLIELCIEDPDKAFEYAMENEIWEVGILCPKWTKDIGNRFLEKFCDDSYAQLISSALGFSKSPFKLHGDWRRYIREVLSTKNASVSNDFIMQVFDNSIPDALFVVLSSYFLGIVDINKYLWMFSKNFEVLKILCYVEYTGRSIRDIDLLKHEFVSIGIEFDRAKAEEYFKANRKCFRKELSGDLDSVFDTRWSFGLKSVFDFGIKKILNVDTLEDDPKKSEISSLGSKCSVTTPPSGTETIGTNVKCEKKEPTEGLRVEEGRALSKREDKKVFVANEMKRDSMYSLPQEEILLKHDEKEAKVKEEELSVSSMPCDTRERNNLYMDTKQSKSFADFFESNRKEEDVRSEDDTSLFLSRFIDDEPSDLEAKKKEQKKGGSFFGFLNMFKKEPIHKANIDVDDDFRYDPVEKKWVGGSSSESKKGDSPVLKPREIPKPKLGMGIPTKCELDMNVTSMYANRKSAGNRSIPGVLGKKNED